MMKWDHV